MTPQTQFLILAPIDAGREASLKSLLASMNHHPGVADPLNGIVPFGRFDRLHFARFIILDDQTMGDITVYGKPRADFPLYLAFLGDVDGPASSFLAELAGHAGAGLRQIFSHCQGFNPDVDLVQWMRAHDQPPATRYVNWLGRTVRQLREEDALRNALEAYVDRNGVVASDARPREIRKRLVEYIQEERRAGHLTLTPPEPTPLSWQLSNLFHFIAVPIALLLLSPFLLLSLPVFIYQLRRRERTDPEIAPRPACAHAKKLAELEDYSVTNQFSAMGSLKPGLFRRWVLTLLLWIIDYTTRHIYNRGKLARVTTIHFARWVFLDNKKRLLFASNYDGSLEAYMDDFINKVGWGLNLVFSNGVGYPRTNWLILDGAKDEQKFKYYIRRHQLPTEVWYDAHTGLTAVDLQRNTLIRQGLEDSSMTDAQTLEWLKLI